MRMLEKHTNLQPLLSQDIQAFDVTPAAKWFLSENDRERYDLVDDFHRLVAPYPKMWMEFEHPSTVYSAERGSIHVRPHSVGVLIETIELPDDFTDKVLPALTHGHNVQADLLNAGLPKDQQVASSAELYAHPDLIQKIAEGEKIRWFSIWGGFTSANMRSPLAVDGCTHFVIRAGFFNQYGRAMPNFIIGSPLTPFLPQHVHSEFLDAAGSSLLPFAFALQLLHCKNVETTPIQVAPKVKMRREKAGIPTVEYKMLSIAPLRKAIQAAGENQGAGSSVKRALHFVRGHFKDFSQGKGLFGKYQGLYWWHDQARGDANKGVIDKDYRVKYE